MSQENERMSLTSEIKESLRPRVGAKMYAIVESGKSRIVSEGEYQDQIMKLGREAEMRKLQKPKRKIKKGTRISNRFKKLKKKQCPKRRITRSTTKRE